LYEACGNRLLIVHLPREFQHADDGLRRELQQAGLSHKADSVLVITGNPQLVQQQGYHVMMDVFEPRGRDTFRPELHGSWSTMCGNGIRAIACYLRDTHRVKEERFIIRTRSGPREVFSLPDNNFRVCMGRFSDEQSDLARYVHDFNMIPLQKTVQKTGTPMQEIIIGLNGNPDAQGHIDGEPHLVIFVKKEASIGQLREWALAIAPLLIADQGRFPEGINISVASIGEKEGKTQHINACTFERGVDYVTASCGTAATVIGSHLLAKDKDPQMIDVHMPGGILHIERDGTDQYYLTGKVAHILMNKAEVR